MLKKKHLKKIGRENSILYRRTRGEQVLFIVVFILFVLYALSLVYPFVWLIINSLKPPLQYINNLAEAHPFALPEKWMFSNYIDAFGGLVDETSGTDFFGMIFNSLWYTVIVVFGSVFVSSVTGYCISKYRFKLRGFLYGIAIFSMTVPIIGTTGANFKLLSDIGVYNTPLLPVVTSLGGFGFNFLIMYGFFKNISWNYAEAVFVDGGGQFTVFFRIMLPQAFPPMLTLAIMTFISAWNDYMTILLYLPSFPTLSSGLFNISKTLTRSGNTPVYFAGLVISMVPIMILFTCFSDVIMKNFTMGGLKG